jgi:hypothetical protein
MVDLQPTPQPPVSPVPAPTPVAASSLAFTQPEPITPKSKLPAILIAFIVLVLLGIGSYFVYQAFLRDSSLQTSKSVESPKPETNSVALEGFVPMADASEQLVYIKNYDSEIYGEEEAILINPTTKNETVLPLKKINFAYKYYGSDLLFYLIQNNQGEYHILNLKTGIDQTFDVLDHSDKTVDVAVYLNNITEISPDGKYMVFNGSYFFPCPSPSTPLPSNFEGGFGPCGPEQSLDNPMGYFLYDVEKNKSTYLQTDTVRISRWDMANDKLYFVENSSTKILDLVDKTLTYADSTSNFGYFTYPLVKKDLLVKFEGGTGDSGNGPFGKINLVKNSDGSETLIDSTNTWTDIQPFLTANDEETDVLYRRSTNINGIHRDSIYRYKLADGKATRVSKDDNSLSYSNYVSWISDHEIVTSVDPIEEEGYSNQNKYLVKIDLNTLEETRLTDHAQVMYFNSQ